MAQPPLAVGPPWLDEVEGGVELQLVVVPRASKTRVVGPHGDRLKVQLAAPPVDGEANAELVELFVGLFGLRKTQVDLRAGATGKRKRVKLETVTRARALEVLDAQRKR